VERKVEGGHLSDIFPWSTCNSAVSFTISSWSSSPSLLRPAKKLRYGCSCGRVSFNCWSPVAFQHRLRNLGPRPANRCWPAGVDVGINRWRNPSACSVRHWEEFHVPPCVWCGTKEQLTDFRVNRSAVLVSIESSVSLANPHQRDLIL
jgi:hypothetical protein